MFEYFQIDFDSKSVLIHTLFTLFANPYTIYFTVNVKVFLGMFVVV